MSRYFQEGQPIARYSRETLDWLLARCGGDQSAAMEVIRSAARRAGSKKHAGLAKKRIAAAEAALEHHL